MSKEKDKVEVINNFGGLIVKINGLIHLNIKGRASVNAIHSYIDEMLPPPSIDKTVFNLSYKLYYIEFHLDNSVVKCTYNNRELWETILKGL